MSANSLTVATWNTEWRRAVSADARLVRERLLALSPDIICLTEAYAELLSGDGHCITSETDYGYPITPGRRKVVLWSREPWDEVDSEGHRDMPPGRFVAGRTSTPAGDLRVVGVCIPWREAHVRSGRRDRQCWEDHLAHLAGLETLAHDWTGPTIVLGDFNQRVPRGPAPAHVYVALEGALLERFAIATAGALQPLGRPAIDHVVHSGDFEAVEVTALSNLAEDGRRISDHFGVSVRLIARR
jgi:endonuclease/exonuclease/phosphatase family metal-dependent hydrolase